jgi:hypothetical protein
MGKRTFVDATAEARCQWNRTLRDGSPAQCGRRHIDGEFCAQHAKMAEANPDLTDEVVRRAAELVVESFPADDMAREELRDGLFDVEQMPPGAIFRVLVRTLRDGKQQGGEVKVSDFDDEELQFYREEVGNLDSMLCMLGIMQITHEGDYTAAWKNTYEAIERLAARQPVGETVGQVRTRVDGGFIAELFLGVADRVSNMAPLYAAPPAQGIDLEQLQRWGLGTVYFYGDEKEDMVEMAGGWFVLFDDVQALIDSQRDAGAGVDRG